MGTNAATAGSGAIEQRLNALIAAGEIDQAIELAGILLRANKGHPNAHMVLGLRALKQRRYAEAHQHFSQSASGPVADLIASLLSAWALYGADDPRGAVRTLDRLSGPDWYKIFKNFHAGLILDLSGDEANAGMRFARAYAQGGAALRVVEAYGSWASRNNNRDDALKALAAFDRAVPRHPLIVGEMQTLQRGEKLPLLVDTAQVGAAEALYGLGAALGRREGEVTLANRGLAYLQLALYLEPSHPMALLSLADLYEAMRRPEQAISVYARMPKTSPLRRNAEIQTAIDLNALGRMEEARAGLERLITNDPEDIEAIMALGNLLRERKQYAECAEVYGQAIARIARPEKANWTTFYFRGICYERSKQWNKAEIDLKKALELYPDQPHVLNYLGYTWIDQGVNLAEGVRMIKRSVEQRPDDGYIVDSLGWAHYRLGNFDEAVRQLEQAVVLKPEDPTISDHLGDAYFKVGKVAEARGRWTAARGLNPEPEALREIEKKLGINVTIAAETPRNEAAGQTRPIETAAASAIAKPRLYALVIGVGDYANAELKLGLPAKDARDLARALEGLKGGLYSEVVVKIAIDREVTRTGMVEGLEWLEKQVTSRDVGLVFLAGHGVMDEKSTYWFLPSDATPATVRTRAVSHDDLWRTLSGLSGKVLLFLDTCHAGRAAADQVGGRGAVDITRVVKEFASAENGIVTFASSQGREMSEERADWGNGAFTKAIIEGLVEGKADYLRNGTITVSQLDAYVANRVKELTGGTQHPVMTRPPTVSDFPIAVVRAKQ